ncbi:Uncharacterized protein dnm_073270 [Desulfonema magnum]|uniref:Uncharacterized protein n=1 Tax=Desulfonema magnum TaxID=45655 RepID=A0A975BTP1_9BACT|nr:Uncharacterized protein dnm_073270 [Desulfonema magnum]
MDNLSVYFVAIYHRKSYPKIYIGYISKQCKKKTADYERTA